MRETPLAIYKVKFREVMFPGVVVLCQAANAPPHIPRAGQPKSRRDSSALLAGKSVRVRQRDGQNYQ